MTDDPMALIHGYLDGQLSDEQVREMNDRIREDPRYAREFASWALLHDRLHDQHRSRAVLEGRQLGRARSSLMDRRWRRRGLAATMLLGIGLAILGARAARREQGVEAEGGPDSRQTRAVLAQALIISNEFLFVD